MVAGDGWPYLITVAVVGFAVYRYIGPLWAIPIALLDTALYFLFRDPLRDVPPAPLGALAPVDGKVLLVGRSRDDPLPGAWVRIIIKTNHLGAYTVRAPIEGSVHDVPWNAADHAGEQPPHGMLLRSEEDHNVVLLFPGRLRALSPKAFVRYGERVGQGHRFAYLRLAPRAEMYLPPDSQARVAVGDRVAAGETILADLPG